jgi:cation-transporting ATPase E
MTGDGVNDVLALKKSDIGIAMGSGAPATRAIAELVLLDGNFATLPGVVAEGRRVAGNIERVANLFLTKTVYATLLTIVIGLAGWQFLFLPRHLTIVSALTIGAPALVLSFAPNKKRYQPGFVTRVLRFTVPAGLVAAGAVMAAGALAHVYRYITPEQSQTMAILVLACVGFWVLIVLSEPFNWWKMLLDLTMIGTFVLIMLLSALWPWFSDLVGLSFPGPQVLLQTAGIAAAALFVLEFLWKFTGWQPHDKLQEDA